MPRRNFPNLDTPIGRAWLTASSVQQIIANTQSIEGDPMLKEEISRLAGAVKLLTEIVEAHILNHGDKS